MSFCALTKKKNCTYLHAMFFGNLIKVQLPSLVRILIYKHGTSKISSRQFFPWKSKPKQQNALIILTLQRHEETQGHGLGNLPWTLSISTIISGVSTISQALTTSSICHNLVAPKIAQPTRGCLKTKAAK